MPLAISDPATLDPDDARQGVEVALAQLPQRARRRSSSRRSRGRRAGRRARAASGTRPAPNRRNPGRGSSRRSRARTRRCRSCRGSTAPRPGPASPGSPGCGRRRSGSRRRAGSGRRPASAPACRSRRPRWCRAQSAVRSISVSASPEMIRNVSSPRNSRTFRTPPAVPSSSCSYEYVEPDAVVRPVAEVLADHVREVVEVRDHVLGSRAARAAAGCGPSPAGRGSAPAASAARR